MRLALDMAVRASGRTFPNPLVGAVVVKDGRVVGEGYHRRAGLPHAEVLALRQAGVKARGAALFCTFEPCFHKGRTPPCVDAVVSSGVSEVYIGVRDPNPMTRGKSIRKLRSAGVRVFEGFYQDEVQRLNEPFFCSMNKRRPLVTLKVAASLDGKTATAAGHSKWMTSALSRAYARRMRGSFDAIMVGIHTVLKDDPRLEGVSGNRLTKVIVDSSLKLPLSARLLKTKQSVIIAVNRTDLKKEKILRGRGVTVLRVPGRNGRVSLKALLGELGRREIRNLLVEGGASLAGSFLDEKLADKVMFYLAPSLMGGREALGGIGGRGARFPRQGARLKDMTIKRIGGDILIEGRLSYRF